MKKGIFFQKLFCIKVWEIITDEDTGLLCFFNTLSNEKSYEKPIGLKVFFIEKK